MPHSSRRASTAQAVRSCLQYLLDDVTSAGLSDSAVKILDAIRAIEQEEPEAFTNGQGTATHDRVH